MSHRPDAETAQRTTHPPTTFLAKADTVIRRNFPRPATPPMRLGYGRIFTLCEVVPRCTRLEEQGRSFTHQSRRAASLILRRGLD